MSIAEIPDNCHTHFRRPTMQEMQILTRDWLMRMTEDTDHLSTSSTYLPLFTKNNTLHKNKILQKRDQL